ncbi:hypothetical protein [Actinoplanes sp. DH11]|uniref:hypothetical protein n=1 Tax=Actinoplanes sp. DH11 TaxID=2857011 RepID=UPI001E544A74|nr:hypothetical protein [Actinoplanes sp. DH11]
MGESLGRRRAATMETLRQALGPANVRAAEQAMDRLEAAVGATPDPVAMLAFGGGKDSSYMVAFVRFVQLLLLERRCRTVRLRIITNRHAGMPKPVLDNIDRVYEALALYDDSDVDLLLIDGTEISEFHPDRPIPAALVQRNRLDLLMAGHRCYGDGRPTFCNACNFSMVSAFGIGAGYNKGAHLVVTGDSPQEARMYLAWVNRLTRKLGIDRPGPRDFDSFVEATGRISDRHFADIYGAPGSPYPWPVPTSGQPSPELFSIYEDTSYESGAHWPVLTEVLGFVFDDLVFSFTESDCANPALMAHLRGLRAETVMGLEYETGVGEYVEFATALMRTKDFPEHLVSMVRNRYATEAGVKAMRARVDAYAHEVFGLTEQHLVCLVNSPFTERGRHLERYLRSGHARLPMSELGAVHRLLDSQDAVTDGRLLAELERNSGLELRWLRVLYRSDLAAPEPDMAIAPVTTIGHLLAGDPHKSVVLGRTRHGETLVPKALSGR